LFELAFVVRGVSDSIIIVVNLLFRLL